MTTQSWKHTDPIGYMIGALTNRVGHPSLGMQRIGRRRALRLAAFVKLLARTDLANEARTGTANAFRIRHAAVSA